MKQMKLWQGFKRGEKGQFGFRVVHGGARKLGKRNEPLPFVPKKWVHLVLKSARARGRFSLLAKHNKQAVARIVSTQAKKCGAEIQNQVNMGNHLHIKIRFFERSQMQRYLRAVPGLIARKVLGAEKGEAKGKFWDGLAFTRIVTSDFLSTRLDGYLRANNLEREFGPEARRTALAELSSWMSLMRRLQMGLPLPS